jgi:hypothetical protein
MLPYSVLLPSNINVGTNTLAFNVSTNKINGKLAIVK